MFRKNTFIGRKSDHIAEVQQQSAGRINFGLPGVDLNRHADDFLAGELLLDLLDFDPQVVDADVHIELDKHALFLFLDRLLIA